jgi:thymidylate synthase (FAD)
MKVKIISYSQDSDQDMEGQVAYCARVSNPVNQDNKDVRGLIKYLIKHKHWSPFEMVNICLEIECTRDIARQILRHRSFSFQEFSQRYADPTHFLDFEERDARMQDETNRQNSLDCQDLDLDAEWKYKQRVLINAADDTYRWARGKGIAKEQARVVLPEGCTVSKMYMNGSLRSWIHYIELRTGPETQLEHRKVAEACREEIAKIFPLIKNIS